MDTMTFEPENSTMIQKLLKKYRKCERTLKPKYMCVGENTKLEDGTINM